ncbi:MAG: hypothetical protein NZ480_07340 [Bdellovibrionaceae bacterium]|nr:hypothetical protein [Pseudobdellovibrionaceae bacterium]
MIRITTFVPLLLSFFLFSIFIFCNSAKASVEDFVPNCYNRGFPLAHHVTCVPAPSLPDCPCGIESYPSCIRSQGWCIDRYTSFPGEPIFPQNKVRVQEPKLRTFVIPLLSFGNANRSRFVEVARYQDPDDSVCYLPSGGEFRVNGGQTVCLIDRFLTGNDPNRMQNEVRNYINLLSLPKLISCRYFDPACSSCCTQWTSPTCATCPPPPPKNSKNNGGP